MTICHRLVYIRYCSISTQSNTHYAQDQGTFLKWLLPCFALNLFIDIQIKSIEDYHNVVSVNKLSLQAIYHGRKNGRNKTKRLSNLVIIKMRESSIYGCEEANESRQH